MENRSKSRIIILVLLSLIVMPIFCSAADADANEKYQEAVGNENEQSYKNAADLYKDAEFLADSVVLKSNAALAAAKAYGKSDLLYKEFLAIENLLDGYPNYVNYGELVNREYEIGDSFSNGHRDVAYWPLRFIPWLRETDRSEEVYEKALKRAPFAQKAPESKLRLAIIKIEKNKIDEGCKLLREIISDYPDSPVIPHAYLRLGSALYQVAVSGDGDGSAGREALEVLKKYLQKYPNTPQQPGVEKLILKLEDVQAKRYKNVADFYHRMGRDAVSERYLNKVLTEYPQSTSVHSSEAMLTELDQTYVPETIRPDAQSRSEMYEAFDLTKDDEKLLVVPEDSDGKWLLPIYEINLPQQNKDAKVK